MVLENVQKDARRTREERWLHVEKSEWFAQALKSAEPAWSNVHKDARSKREKKGGCTLRHLSKSFCHGARKRAKGRKRNAREETWLQVEKSEWFAQGKVQHFHALKNVKKSKRPNEFEMVTGD